MKQIFQVTFGAHFAMRSLNPAFTPKFDEGKISAALDTQLVENGGIVESYSMLSGSMHE